MNPEIIELEEYKSLQLPSEKIPIDIGKLLKKHYGSKISVEFPSVGTDNRWKLTARGWIGFIPLSPQLTLRLSPKVEISKLFQILEYAYTFNLNFEDDLINCAAIEDFYERLAKLLALKVLSRAQKGFYRTYVSATERLFYVRGRIDIKRATYVPWDVKLKCCFQELTGDVPENQLLAWTLFLIVNSSLCHKYLPIVRQSYQSLQGLVTMQRYNSYDCIGMDYNRLNEDYRTLHALCRFFLESTGASHHLGEHMMLAFLVDMAQLFELFVAEWLFMNLPVGYSLKRQEIVGIGIEESRSLKIDLVIYDIKNGSVYCVLDTKYKNGLNRIDNSDLYQVTTYAVAKGTNEAVLVYPQSLNKDLVFKVQDIRIRALAFSLDGDLQKNGQAFLDLLLSNE
jgi:5-methylcytosine-specific restriction enzyme subunit McrC